MAPWGKPWIHGDGASLRETIRRRPEVYVGDVHNGLGVLRLLCEVVDNVVNLHHAGDCTRADIRLHRDGSFSVSDDGPGMAVEELLGERSFLDAVLTDFHGSSLRRSTPRRLPERSLLFGLGLSAVNHFSSAVEVEVARGGALYRQRFVGGAAKRRISCEGATARTGTTLLFHPDPTIFSSARPSLEQVLDFLYTQALLAPGLQLTLFDEISGEGHQLYFPEGMVASVVERMGGPSLTPARAPIFHVAGEDNHTLVDVVVTWCSSSASIIESFANLRRTQEGAHVDGLISATADAFDRLAQYGEGGLTHRPRGLANPALRGMIASIAVQSRSATFQGTHNEKLVSPEIARSVYRVMNDSLRTFFAAEPDLVRWMLARR